MMKKFQLHKKIILITLIILFLAIAAFISSLFIYGKGYKAYLLGEINKLSEFQYSADTIDFHFFPDISITMINIFIDYKKQNKSVNIFKAENLIVRLPWTAVWTKTIKIKSITAENGEANIYWNLFLKDDAGISGAGSSGAGGADAGFFSELKNITLTKMKITLFENESAKGKSNSKSLSFDNFCIDLGGSYKSGDLLTDIEIDNLTLSGNVKKNITRLPGIYLKSSAEYSGPDNIIKFSDTDISCGNIIKAKLSGNISLQDKYNLNLAISAEELFFNPLTELISEFIELKPKIAGSSGKNFVSNMEINSGSFLLWDRQFLNFSGKVEINNKNVYITRAEGTIYDGRIECAGFVITGDPVKYYFQLSASNIDTEKLLSTFTDKKSITGKMDYKIDLSSKGDSLDPFKANLNSRGKITIRNGELANQADILKPLFSLGKLVNLLGPKGKSTGFKTLVIDYNIRNENINIENLKMKGVGLDAKGKGRIGFDKSIDMRITVGLGGLVGRVINVPIIYKGEIFKSWPYVDPWWLGSIYVGIVILPGGGAVVGPTVYETVRKWLDKLKSGSSEPKDE